MPKEFHYRWVWDLESPPEDLWPMAADTNRFNKDGGVPEIEFRDRDGEAPMPYTRPLRIHTMGMTIDWEEEPFEWVRPRRFGVVRRYTRGPITVMRMLCELEAREGGGARMTYQVWATARNFLGRLAIPMQIGRKSAKSFEAAFRAYDALAKRGRNALDLPPARVEFAPGGRERMSGIVRRLKDEGADPVLVDRIAEVVATSDDLPAMHLRPYALADHWGAPRRPVLEHFLRATRAGLFDFQWDLLCPLCRGAKFTAGALQDIRPQVHCDACRIDFDANFEQSVELTFRPNPAVRPIEAREYCVGGPQLTPHIVVQQILAPQERRDVAVALEPGRYRVRAWGLSGGRMLTASAAGSSALDAAITDDGWPSGELVVSTSPQIAVENRTDREQVFILERTAWSDQAATAADVIALQAFRDLFSGEALRPGERISVGRITILFTDLLASTRLYREIGDAPAFGKVMEHFDVLRDAIAAEDGAIVKTIGDAVMGVFRRPVSALRAVRKARRGLKPPIVLKAGIHTGPAIAVTLNEKLDYFGSTVNIAARFVGFSEGDDAIISDEIRADPEVAAELGPAEPVDGTLKGLETERIAMYRVR